MADHHILFTIFDIPHTIISPYHDVLFDSPHTMIDKAFHTLLDVPPPINDCEADPLIVLYSHHTMALDTASTTLLLPTTIALFLSFIVLSEPPPINDTFPPILIVLFVPQTIELRSDPYDLLYAPHTATLPLLVASLYKPPHTNAA